MTSKVNILGSVRQERQLTLQVASIRLSKIFGKNLELSLNFPIERGIRYGIEVDSKS